MLLFFQIILGLVFSVYSIAIMTSYNHNVPIGIILSVGLLFLYYFMLYKSSKLYENEKKGLAYFLTIGGFFIVVFLQIITCTNSLLFYSH